MHFLFKRRDRVGIGVVSVSCSVHKEEQDDLRGPGWDYAKEDVIFDWQCAVVCVKRSIKAHVMRAVVRHDPQPGGSRQGVAGLDRGSFHVSWCYLICPRNASQLSVRLSVSKVKTDTGT